MFEKYYVWKQTFLLFFLFDSFFLCIFAAVNI